MTMPKTLAALPNSQYDTDLVETSGKELANEAAFFLDALDVIFLPRLAIGEGEAAVLWERKALRNGLCLAP